MEEARELRGQAAQLRERIRKASQELRRMREELKATQAAAGLLEINRPEK
jgi:hypothetical protein